MTTILHNTNKIIATPFPTKEFKKILLKNGVTDVTLITPKQMKKIYILTVDLFLKGNLSTDGISSIFNRLFTRATYLKDEDKNILPAVIAASELSFYVRNPELTKLFVGFLKDVFNYRNMFGKELSSSRTLA